MSQTTEVLAVRTAKALGGQRVGDTTSGLYAISVTDNGVDHARSRGVYVGVSQSLDFSFDGTTWITFSGCVAGTILPIQVVGARKTAGSAAPDAGDVVFLY
jgi:hypothetical protein